MAIDYIPIDRSTTTATHGPDLINLVASIRSTVNLLDKVKAVMDHNNDGSTFTAIETLFGLPSGKGQTVYDLINGTRGAIGGSMQNSNTLSLIDRVG